MGLNLGVDEIWTKFGCGPRIRTNGGDKFGCTISAAWTRSLAILQLKTRFLTLNKSCIWSSIISILGN